MPPTELRAIGEITTAKVVNYAGAQSKLINCRLILTQEAYGEEGVFYPAQTISLYGKGLDDLRKLLNELPTE